MSSPGLASQRRSLLATTSSGELPPGCVPEACLALRPAQPGCRVGTEEGWLFLDEGDFT